MKKLFLLIGLLITNGLSATSALYLHHERSTQANTEADCQNREMCLDKINLAPIGRFNDGTLWHGVTQEKPNVNLTGTLNVTGATVLANNLTLSLFATGRIPYTTTAGLLTSGTGLAYNGSAFSVTGTGAFSGDFAINTNKFNITGSNGNTSIAGNLGVTGAAALDAQTTIKGAASSTSRPLVLRTGLSSGGANNDYVDMFFRGINTGTSIIDGGSIRCTFTDVTARNAKIGIYGSLAEVQTLGLEVASTGAVTIPSTLAVTGASTLTGGVTFGNPSPTTLNAYKEGTFTCTATGMTTSPTGTASYVLIGKSVTLILPAITGTSNSTSFTYTGLPSEIQPATTQRIVINQATDAMGGTTSSSGGITNTAQVTSSGTITFFYGNSSTGWSSSAGTKGLPINTTISYTIQ